MRLRGQQGQQTRWDHGLEAAWRKKMIGEKRWTETVGRVEKGAPPRRRGRLRALWRTRTRGHWQVQRCVLGSDCGGVCRGAAGGIHRQAGVSGGRVGPSVALLPAEPYGALERAGARRASAQRLSASARGLPPWQCGGTASLLPWSAPPAWPRHCPRRPAGRFRRRGGGGGGKRVMGLWL